MLVSGRVYFQLASGDRFCVGFCMVLFEALRLQHERERGTHGRRDKVSFHRSKKHTNH